MTTKIRCSVCKKFTNGSKEAAWNLCEKCEGSDEAVRRGFSHTHAVCECCKKVKPKAELWMGMCQRCERNMEYDD